MAQNEINEILKIDGMSCSGCELRIEEKLNSIPGVLEVRNCLTVTILLW